jgi:CHAT domain-containing protein
LPLHTLPLSDGQLLFQRYCISYAPSISLLKEMRSKAWKSKGKELYAVINPQKDPALVFSRCESKAISRVFQSSRVDEGEIATKPTVKDAVSGRSYIHFSCHGSYDWNDPPQSGLSLYGDRTLSLADLQSGEIDMSSARLVSLSACETGITDIIKGSAEEFVGLPAGFMLAGVPCVVSSLWSVPDISTALLMERFYSNHIGGMDIPSALQGAQLWVRDLTATEVAEHVEKCYRSGKWEGKSKEFIEMYRKRFLELAREAPDNKPFENPHYWAAFTVNGA